MMNITIVISNLSLTFQERQDFLFLHSFCPYSKFNLLLGWSLIPSSIDSESMMDGSFTDLIGSSQTGNYLHFVACFFPYLWCSSLWCDFSAPMLSTARESDSIMQRKEVRLIDSEALLDVLVPRSLFSVSQFFVWGFTLAILASIYIYQALHMWR